MPQVPAQACAVHDCQEPNVGYDAWVSFMKRHAHPCQARHRRRVRRAGRLAVVVCSALCCAGLAPIPTYSGETTSNELRERPRLWSVSVRWENDTFGGTDRFYTDGVSLSVSHTGRSWLDPLAAKLPTWLSDGRRTVSYELGQIMCTPSDITVPVPDPGDRPYAGLLYAAVSFHFERGNAYNGLKLVTGVVGPWSLAEETQKEVHRIVKAPIPQGWAHQLHNEPIMNLVLEHRRKFRLLGEPDSFSAEAIPCVDLMLGNVLTQGEIGAQVRLGWNVPDDFGVTSMRGMVHLPPPHRMPAFGLYVYGGAYMMAVARNITLDGNTWRSSPSVDKEYFVPAAELGVGTGTRHFQAAFSYVFWGREFKGQPDHTEFGAFTFTYVF